MALRSRRGSSDLEHSLAGAPPTQLDSLAGGNLTLNRPRSVLTAKMFCANSLPVLLTFGSEERVKSKQLKASFDLFVVYERRGDLFAATPLDRPAHLQFQLTNK